MDKQALAEITVFNKYARFNNDLGRRENWEEIVTRNKDMHITKYPHMREEIEEVYRDYVYTKRVLPSMRSLQFGGRPILMTESRIFNCAYAPAESVKFFSELMFLLLGGTGMGYSVQSMHINKLPKVKSPESDSEYKFQVQDSIVGWSDAIKVVCKAFFSAGTLPIFDYRDIREKGAELITTGGLAPGSDPLKKCVEELVKRFRQAIGRKLRPIEVHDMACIIADAVLAGGIRRAAMISLFDREDEEMLNCKAGEWYIDHPYRARSNNSAVLLRGEVTEQEFKSLMKRIEASGCGEPGVYWTNNKNHGTNPCCEIALKPYEMCNLTEINAGKITDQDSYNDSASAASFIGTLQAGYTDFHYLNPKWRETCEEEALLGVSMTGIASGTIENLDSEEAAACVKHTNYVVSEKIGINPAARTTCVKPA